MKEYINRKELSEEIETAIYVYHSVDVLTTESIRKGLKMLLDKIIDVPVADVREVVHAKWENIEPYTAINGQYLKAQVCSNCDALFVSGGNEPYNNYPYCCVCGAKMDKDEVKNEF